MCRKDKIPSLHLGLCFGCACIWDDARQGLHRKEQLPTGRPILASLARPVLWIPLTVTIGPLAGDDEVRRAPGHTEENPRRPDADDDRAHDIVGALFHCGWYASIQTHVRPVISHCANELSVSSLTVMGAACERSCPAAGWCMCGRVIIGLKRPAGLTTETSQHLPHGADRSVRGSVSFANGTVDRLRRRW